MESLNSRFPLWIFCLFGFISTMGIGIAYPTFSFIALEPNTVVALHSNQERALFLGFVLSIAPLISLFIAPFVGAIADRKGRKPILLTALALTATGSILCAIGIRWDNVPLIIVSRAVAGFGIGGAAALNAAVADISPSEKKSENYALLNAACSFGIMFGPFIGGKLAQGGNYSAPFAIAAALTIVNLLLMAVGYKDRFQPSEKSLGKHRSIFSDIKTVFDYPSIRILLFSAPLMSVGFIIYWQFISINWIEEYKLTESQVGDLYSYGAIWFALSSAFLIRPLLKRFKDISLTWVSSVCLSFLTLFLFFRTGIFWFWIIIPFQEFFLSVLGPTAVAYISNQVKETDQGKILGSLQSISSASMAIAPLFGGLISSMSYDAHILFGGLSLLAASVVILLGYKSQIFEKRA